MKSKLFTLIALVLISFWFIQSCTKNPDSYQLKATKLVLPDNNYVYYEGSANKNQIATVGRVLFYDKSLSATNAIACASCHFQANAFADGKQFSTGFKNELTSRNSMGFSNLANNSGFFWDLRESNLTEMVLKPISNHVEMGFTDINAIAKKLKQYPDYQNLFAKAFSDGVTVENIAISIATFLEAIRCENSKFDIALNASNFDYTFNFPSFTPVENKGKQLFIKNGCIDCHNPNSNFQRSWSNWANIGLDLNYTDKGIAGNNTFVLKFGIMDTALNGSFKIPSLRNVALTAPYMHDGRFATLNDVLNHYSEGIKNHKDLSWELSEITNNVQMPKRFNYTKEDKEALVAFLKTLTDYKMISDPKFSNPFQVVAN
ncbi:MAG: cytochrome c peroxidase [Bacteroidota bacterium]